jgi:hypothetical protein
VIAFAHQRAQQYKVQQTTGEEGLGIYSLRPAPTYIVPAHCSLWRVHQGFLIDSLVDECGPWIRISEYVLCLSYVRFGVDGVLAPHTLDIMIGCSFLMYCQLILSVSKIIYFFVFVQKNTYYYIKLNKILAHLMVLINTIRVYSKKLTAFAHEFNSR